MPRPNPRRTNQCTLKPEEPLLVGNVNDTKIYHRMRNLVGTTTKAWSRQTACGTGQAPRPRPGFDSRAQSNEPLCLDAGSDEPWRRMDGLGAGVDGLGAGVDGPLQFGVDQTAAAAASSAHSGSPQCAFSGSAAQDSHNNVCVRHSSFEQL